MKHRNRKGAVLPLIAVMMVTLVLLLGLMVELNWLYSTRFEAQSASDLATRSALAKLYDNQGELDENSVEEAKAFGVDIYGLNFNRSAPIDTDDIAFGELDRNHEFQEFSGDGNLRDISASRVQYSQRFTSMLGTLIAKNEVDLGVFSVAEAGQVDMVLSLDSSRSMNKNSTRDRRLPPNARSIHERPMLGSRWFALRDATGNFITQLESADVDFGLVTFGGGLSHSLVSPLDAQFSRIEEEIGPAAETGPLVLDVMDQYTELPALGFGTSIYDAIEDGITLLERRNSPARRYIVLFTDGEQVVFGERPDELVAAREAADKGIVIFTIGYDLSEGALDEIADITGGESFSVDNPRELAAAFSSIAALIRTRIVQ